LPPPSFNDAPFTATAYGLRVAIRLTPRARADRIDGVIRNADGTSAVKVSVTAPPADNRANEALIALLAEEWHLPRRDLTLIAGSKSRSKTVQVAGDPHALRQKLADALASVPAA